MTQHSAALTLGGLVFQTAHRNGGNRHAAADKVMADLFPALGARNRIFVKWALLQAETMYVRRERPALSSEGQDRTDTHAPRAPDGDASTHDGAGHAYVDTQSAPAPPSPSDDDADGGHVSHGAPKEIAPIGRRRLTLQRADPADYPIVVNGERKRLGDLTREDWGHLYGYHRNKRRNQEQREKGYRRIYDKMPEGARFEDVMDDVLDEKDRAFLADELGVRELEGAA